MTMARKKNAVVFCPFCGANNDDGSGQEKVININKDGTPKYDLNGNELTEDMLLIWYKVISPVNSYLSVRFIEGGMRGNLLQGGKDMTFNNPHFIYTCGVCGYPEIQDRLIPCD